jgi:hypothetical protein
MPSHHKHLRKSDRRGTVWLAFGLAAGMLCASLPVSGASGKCASHGYVELAEPVVTVLDGPGSVADEQAVWESFTEIRVWASDSLSISPTWFSLERTSP